MRAGFRTLSDDVELCLWVTEVQADSRRWLLSGTIFRTGSASNEVRA